MDRLREIPLREFKVYGRMGPDKKEELIFEGTLPSPIGDIIFDGVLTDISIRPETN